MASITTDRRRGINASAAIKVACIAASTGNLTLSAEQTVDGIALVEGDRCFAKDQTDATEIGIYKVATGDWVREPDFDGTFDVSEGTIIPVSRGTANADTYWKVTNIGTITIGTTEITVAATTVLSSAILSDGSVKMAANFSPVASATYSLGVSTGKWTSAHLSSAINSNSAAVSSNSVVEGTITSCGTVTASSNVAVTGTLAVTDTVSLSSDATVSGAFQSSGTVTGSSKIILSLLTTTLSGSDPSVEGQLWASSGYIRVSTG